MIKTIVDHTKKRELKFPCLMKSKNGNTIILAINTEKGKDNISGIVLAKDFADDWKLGEQSTQFEGKCFEVFNGKLTMENTND